MSDQKVEYYRITKDWQIVSGDSPETVHSDATLNWIKIYQSSYRTHTTSFKNTYKLRDFDITDRHGGESTIAKENYSIERLKESYASAYGCEFQVCFRDSFGETREVIIRDWKKALEKLDELDEFHSWKEYDLSQENEKFTANIETLEAEKSELKKEIESLKDEIKELKKRKRSVKPKKKP
jgi:hypothetical protein